MNKAILIGNLGKDPELRYTASGTAVCSFSVATTQRRKDKDDETTWHNVVAWTQLAEICGKYLQKGSKVAIEGRIQTRSYDDRDGNKRYVTEIVADQMEMLGAKGEMTPERAAAAVGGTVSGAGGGEPPFNPDDDLPFNHNMKFYEFTK